MATQVVAPAPAPASPGNELVAPKKNQIQVSNTKKPLFFYVNLAKRYMQQHNEVELSALGMAIATVVTIAEILKNNGLAVEKKVLTSTYGMKDEAKGRLVQKARIEIVLEKSENFETLMNNTPKKGASGTNTPKKGASGTNTPKRGPTAPNTPKRAATETKEAAKKVAAA